MISFANFFPALLFYLLPVATGRTIAVIFLRKEKVPMPWVCYFITGSLTLFALVLLEKYLILPFWPILPFTELLQYTVYGVVIFSFFINLVFGRKRSDLSLGGLIYPVFLSLTLSFAVYVIWTYATPVLPNWDIYEHQLLANLIQKGQFSFVTSQISDAFTFNGYSSFFHFLLAISQVYPPADILSYWSSLTFIHLFLSILATYLLAKIVTDNSMVGILAAILGAFIFESQVVYTTLFFIPQTLAACFFILLLVQLFAALSEEKHLPVRLIIPSLIFLVISHYIVGSLAAFIYLAVILYCRYYQGIYRRIKNLPVLELGMVFLLVMVILSTVIPLGYINKGEAEFYAFDILDKFKFLRISSGYLLLVLFPIGVIAALRKKTFPLVTCLAIVFLTLGIVATTFPYVLKFYVLARYFVCLFAALGIYKMSELIDNILFRYLARAVFIVVAVAIFIVNNAYFKDILLYKDKYTQVSPSEIEAAKFLKTNYEGKDTLLVSEPATQNILESLSGINTQGGAYSSDYTRSRLHFISQMNNPAEIKALLFRINDNITDKSKTRLLALSGRYFRWQAAEAKDKESYYFNIWKPWDLSFAEYKYIDGLAESNAGFRVVYDNGGMAILEIEE